MRYLYGRIEWFAVAGLDSCWIADAYNPADAFYCDDDTFDLLYLFVPMSYGYDEFDAALQSGMKDSNTGYICFNGIKLFETVDTAKNFIIRCIIPYKGVYVLHMVSSPASYYFYLFMKDLRVCLGSYSNFFKYVKTQELASVLLRVGDILR